jgi:hypothetical protein
MGLSDSCQHYLNVVGALTDEAPRFDYVKRRRVWFDRGLSESSVGGIVDCWGWSTGFEFSFVPKDRGGRLEVQSAELIGT